MTASQQSDWRELCEFLDDQPGKSASKTSIPDHLIYLLSDRHRRERKKLDIVYYAAGWGWRLRRGWTTRLDKAS